MEAFSDDRSTCTKMVSGLGEAEEASWDEFVTLYSPLIYHWCRRMQLDQHDAADVVQEVFRAVHRAVPEFKRRRTGSFRSWLRTITTNKAHDHFRRVSHSCEGEGGSSAVARLQSYPEIVDAMESSETICEQTLITRQAAEIARTEVGPKIWQAFESVVMEGQPAWLVAEKLGMSVGSVYTLKSRILRRIRELVDAA